MPAEASSSGWLRRMHGFLCGAGLNILLTVAAGVITSLLFPPHELWWAGWLCLAPLLIALRRTTAVRASAWLMLLYGIVFFAVTLPWLARIFGAGAVGIVIIATLPWLLFGMAYRMLGSRSPGVATVLLAPVLWLAAEWLRCEGWYFAFSWAQLGFSFVACPRGSALYPWIGVYGVTFLLMLADALVVEILLARMCRPRKALGLALWGLAAILLSLLLRLPAPSSIAHGMGISVAVVQDESSTLDTLKTHTLAAAAEHPILVVWPEYALASYPLSEKEVLRDLQEIARTAKATLVLGCKEHAPPDVRCDWLRRRAMMTMDGALSYNSALVIDPQGTVIGTYHKNHPIPFFNDGVPGRAFPTFQTPAGRLGVSICFDFDFANDLVQHLRGGTTLLVVPTYDATTWGQLQHIQHSRMAQARAAEASRWVVRATSSGISQIIDPTGRVTASIPFGQSAYAVGTAAPIATLTPYATATYLLPYACISVSLLWLLAVLLRVIAARRKHVLAQSEDRVETN